MTFFNVLRLSKDALKKDLWKTPKFHVYLSKVCLKTYKKSGNHLLSFKMPTKHNIRSQLNLGVLQTPDSACAPLKFKLSKWRLSLKLVNITKKALGSGWNRLWSLKTCISSPGIGDVRKVENLVKLAHSTRNASVSLSYFDFGHNV